MGVGARGARWRKVAQGGARWRKGLSVRVPPGSWPRALLGPRVLRAAPTQLSGPCTQGHAHYYSARCAQSCKGPTRSPLLGPRTPGAAHSGKGLLTQLVVRSHARAQRGAQAELSHAGFGLGVWCPPSQRVRTTCGVWSRSLEFGAHPPTQRVLLFPDQTETPPTHPVCYCVLLYSKKFTTRARVRP